MIEVDKPIKILHYCWFGGNPLPPETVEYMKSWKKFLPDFEIMRWDESNFDVDSVAFTAQAYKEKKWAFVSDYVRCYALYKYGGLYLDTDVEMIKPIDDLLRTSFIGFERHNVLGSLILYADEPGKDLYKKLLARYENENFDISLTTPILFTQQLIEMGIKRNNTLQTVGDITVYPMDYFNPIGNDISSKPKITENTRAIHWFQASWYSAPELNLFNKRKKYGYFWGTVLFTLAHPVQAWRRHKSNQENKENLLLPDNDDEEIAETQGSDICKTD